MYQALFETPKISCLDRGGKEINPQQPLPSWGVHWWGKGGLSRRLERGSGHSIRSILQSAIKPYDNQRWSSCHFLLLSPGDPWMHPVPGTNPNNIWHSWSLKTRCTEMPRPPRWGISTESLSLLGCYPILTTGFSMLCSNLPLLLIRYSWHYHTNIIPHYLKLTLSQA